MQSDESGEEDFDASTDTLWQELFATQIAFVALIEAHPDKERLLSVFDSVVTNIQLYGAQHGGVPLTHTITHEALQRYRSQIKW